MLGFLTLNGGGKTCLVCLFHLLLGTGAGSGHPGVSVSDLRCPDFGLCLRVSYLGVI